MVGAGSKGEGPGALQIFRSALNFVGVAAAGQVQLNLPVTHEVIAPIRLLVRAHWFAIGIFEVDTTGQGLARPRLNDGDSDSASGGLGVEPAGCREAERQKGNANGCEFHTGTI